MDLRKITADRRGSLQACRDVGIDVSGKDGRLRIAFGQDLASFRITNVVLTKSLQESLQRGLRVLGVFLHVGDDQMHRKGVATKHRQLIVRGWTNDRDFRALCRVERKDAAILQQHDRLQCHLFGELSCVFRLKVQLIFVGVGVFKETKTELLGENAPYDFIDLFLA